jgi:recombinational DNA repair protein (RecF pathway)
MEAACDEMNQMSFLSRLTCSSYTLELAVCLLAQESYRAQIVGLLNRKLEGLSKLREQPSSCSDACDQSLIITRSINIAVKYY